MSTPSLSGNQLLINSTLISVQSEPEVAALPDGRSVIVWVDSSAASGDNSSDAIRGQIVLADGSPEGDEFLINSLTTGSQNQPDVTALVDGGFVVTWTTGNLAGGDGNGSAIKAQVFDSGGRLVVSELLVNQLGSGSQSLSTVTGLADGGFAVAWQGAGVVGGALEDMGLRLFNSDGSPRGGEINWTEGGLTAARQPAITQLGNGNLLVAYMSNDDDSFGVMGRIFTAAGAAVTDGFDINTTMVDNQTQPDVVALAGGGFVVTWTDISEVSDDTSGEAVRAQVFTAAGVEVGEEILVNTTIANNQNEPSVTALSDGRFLIAWTDQSSGTTGWDIRAQLFNSDGSASGNEFRVNTVRPGNQSNPAVAELSDGRIMVSWRDAGGFGSGDIAAQIIDPREAAISFNGTGSADIAVGTRFQDTLNGRNGDDTLAGEAGNDVINGGRGRDTLDGGRGKDPLTGKSGPDVFVYDAVSDSTVEKAGRDRITDFRPGADKIDLSAIDAIRKTSGDDAFVFLESSPLTGLGQVRAFQSGANTFIDINTTGSTAPDMRIVLSGVHVLDAGDFIL